MAVKSNNRTIAPVNSKVNGTTKYSMQNTTKNKVLITEHNIIETKFMEMLKLGALSVPSIIFNL